MGFAPDPAQPGEFLPSFGQNITQGKPDAGLQALGGAGEMDDGWRHDHPAISGCWDCIKGTKGC